MSQPPKPKAEKREAAFLGVLVFIIGLVLTCVAVITIGLFQMSARKELECRCPDGSVVKEVTSAMFSAEKACPAICEAHAKQSKQGE